MKLSAAEEETLRLKNMKFKAASCIQALARGVAARKLYKRILPVLRQQQRARQFCVECEAKVATKRCRICKDNYCDACFLIVHKRGTRMRHDWEPMRVNAATTISTNNTNDVGFDDGNNNSQQYGGGARAMSTKKSEKGVASGKMAANTNNRADWEQFYDANAKAKYWFNAKTGEASWTTPTFT